MTKRTGIMLFVCFSVLPAFGPALTTAGTSGPIIVDHTCTDISRIPDYWIEAAKRLTIHYAHTSHGNQIYQGAENLESQDPKYSFSRRESSTAGLPPVQATPALRMYDGNPPETYIEPDDYWDGESGKDRTRAVAATRDYDYSMWAWCGQVSWADRDYIQDYLETLDQFENEYPGMRFIYMTGHLDGSGSAGNLHVRNEQIRSYCRANNKVLFDFADIESYGPDGTDYLAMDADDGCNYSGGNWAQQWCSAHPASALCEYCECSHSEALNCNRKARAFWWMMARLAGWDPSAAPTPGIQANGSAGPVTVTAGTPVAIQLAMSSGGNYGQSSDWWVVEITPAGTIRYLDLAQGSMADMPAGTLVPTYQGGLFDFGYVQILNLSDLSEGTHQFYFGVDLDQNGWLDGGNLYYGWTVVTVTAPLVPRTGTGSPTTRR
jgi:hypothetical protein